jgi:two-component system cell cycle sensor histidine kinase/response regulator CckA
MAIEATRTRRGRSSTAAPRPPWHRLRAAGRALSEWLISRPELVRQAFDMAPGAQLIVAPDGRITCANAASRRLFETTGGPPPAGIEDIAADPSSRAALRGLQTEVAAGGRPVAALVLRHADAPWRCRISAKPIGGFPGFGLWSISDAAVSALDFSETPPSETKQHGSGDPSIGAGHGEGEPGDEPKAVSPPPRGWFQRFFAQAPIGIALVDSRGRFVEANRAVGALFDRDPHDLIGRELTSLLGPADRAGVAAALAADGEMPPEPIEVRRDGPCERTFVLFLGRLDIGTQTEAAAVLHLIDVTERKNLERQFVQSQKMQAVGQLAGGIAHDFNNLLTAMIGFCDLLLLRCRPGDPSFADIMQIRQNASRAANLVRQLLAFSRQQALQPRILDITDILVELSHLLRRLIGENIEFEIVHGRDLGLVKVDQGQFEQVVINLVINARDAMPGGGRLTIRTRTASYAEPHRRGHEAMPAGDYVLIEVADTGVGIPAAHLERIFEPFFSTKEGGSGTGLGLSTVYGIVRQTGGFVFVDSVPGGGSRFQIYLPRCRAEDLPAVRPEAVAPAVTRDLTGSGRVMLVEDDDPVRIFAARALRNKGYTVLEAKSGEAALEQIRGAGDTVDLLITDVVMPVIDGPRLVREVRELDQSIRVIFISGYAEDAFRQRLDSERDIHFLAKPFSLKQLAMKVKEVLNTRGSDIQPSDRGSETELPS